MERVAGYHDQGTNSPNILSQGNQQTVPTFLGRSCPVIFAITHTPAIRHTLIHFGASNFKWIIV